MTTVTVLKLVYLVLLFYLKIYQIILKFWKFHEKVNFYRNTKNYW